MIWLSPDVVSFSVTPGVLPPAIGTMMWAHLYCTLSEQLAADIDGCGWDQCYRVQGWSR